jgi:transcription initiation factor IIE alpha subunit
MELRVYGPRLSLSITDRAVIEAIDQLPDGWDVTREALGKAAGCSETTVKRVVKKLDDAGLVKRHERRFRRNITGVQYDLTPLWDRLAQEARNETSAQIDPRGGQIDPQRGGQNDPQPFRCSPVEESRRSRSVDVERARKPETTTTTTGPDPSDGEESDAVDWDWVNRCNDAFADYEYACRHVLGYVPARRPEDLDAVEAMEAIQANEPDEPSDADVCFSHVLWWALKDRGFSRERWAKGLANAVRCFNSTRAKYVSVEHPTCDWCEREMPPWQDDDLSLCADCRATHAEWQRDNQHARSQRNTDDRPIVTCAVNNCEQRFHTDEPDAELPLCPSCDRRFQEMKEDPGRDEIPGFDDDEIRWELAS